jgi:outer membrane receptor for ferrienterochelin and colicin
MIRLRKLLVSGLVLAGCLGVAPRVLGQGITRGEIFGRITDSNGSPLPHVVVTLKSPDLTTTVQATTGADGRYRLPDILPGRYTMTVELSGYTTVELNADVRVGSLTRFDHAMKTTPEVKEQVAVTGALPRIESVTSQVNKYISFQEIQNLPLQNRNFLDVLRTVPGVSTGVPTGTYADRGPRNSFNIHGERSNQNEFLLDGATNNDLSDLNYEDIASTQILGGPTSSSGAGRAGQSFDVGTALQTYNLDAIQEVQVSTSLMSAEYGSGGSGGVINVITRSGTDLFRGSATVQEQRDAWVKGSEKQSIKRDQGAVVLGGPILKGKTHFFVTYERSDEKLGYDFSQPTYEVPAYLYGKDLTANETIRDSVTAKLSQMFNPSHTLTVTANNIGERAHVNNSLFRERQIQDIVPEWYYNNSLGFIVRDLAVLSDNTSLESVVNTTGADRIFNSKIDSPREIYSYYDPSYHSYTTGENSPDSDNRITTFGLSEKFSLMGSNTANKFGAGVDYFRQRSKQAAYISYYNYPDRPAYGTSYLAYPVTDFSVSVTSPWAFAQTDWFVNSKTTLNLGVRVDHDDLVGETTVEPRAGIAYDPAGNGREVFRAGVGIYHDRSNLIGVTGALRPPVVQGDVVDGQLVQSGLPSEVVVDPNLKLPTIYKVILGYQRQFGQNTTAGITLFGNFSRDLFFTDYQNREDADGNRPDPTHGGINYYSNFGKSDVFDAELEVHHTFRNGSLVQVSYTYEHTRGNSSFDFLSGNDDLNRGTYAAGQPHPQSFWGPLNFDQEHTLKVTGVFNLPLGFQFSTFIQWNTGRPYFWYTSWYELPSYTAHFDFYGGGFNSQRLDDQFNADIRLAKTFKIADMDLMVFLDGFNVTDHQNVIQRLGLYAYNYGAPIGEAGTTYYTSWKRPYYGPRRSAELGLKLSF